MGGSEVRRGIAILDDGRKIDLVVEAVTKGIGYVTSFHEGVEHPGPARKLWTLEDIFSGGSAARSDLDRAISQFYDVQCVRLEVHGIN